MRLPPISGDRSDRRRGPRSGGALLHGAAVLIAAVPAMLAIPQPATAQPATGEAVTAEILTANGTGCPAPDQVTATVSPDGSYLHLTYEGFRAEAGDGTLPTDRRKNCQLELVLHHPADVTFAMPRADFFGTVRLPAGATGTVNVRWSWRNDVNYRRTSFMGPLDEEFRATQVIEIGPTFEECGQNRPLHLDTELRVRPDTSDPAPRSVIALAAGPDAVSASYSLLWQPCPTPGPEAG